ncbi:MULTISPECIES: N-acetyltransferase [unclassified Paenibacillus]|uniref:GNAT family N-acetyltransferase n=1 Tax=unclassified Paenibacillus TaxID=185978 RepID=UPI00095639E7|nr:MULTISPECIES: N-acetyltransferase [unclassified Paenibacillus]ASS65839.1 N-acetyltransferase [Paenibacillus sp. RUD330]SIQ21866.1 putative acetyltransferase [Paenibacillus sp. RU4X]SIQ43607.1 putative acetyltransferase [Paenibacillus sp. RU4T]
MRIRTEMPRDIGAIHEINALAFGREDEALLVAAVRASAAFVPELSLVAEEDGALIGHILFSVASVETPEGKPEPTLALAPMAVKPEFQQRGIGSELVREGLERAAELGFRHAIVLGHPEFYPRFGFRPARPSGIEAPFPVPEEAFMAVELLAGALEGISGIVRYPAAFDSVNG